MKLGNIVSTDQKAQLVIPSSVRLESDITRLVPHKLLSQSATQYLDILQKTKGSWRTEKGNVSHQEKLGLKASEKINKPGNS